MSLQSQDPTNSIKKLKNTNVTGNVVLKLGERYIWMDADGHLRVKGTNPTGDKDGSTPSRGQFSTFLPSDVITQTGAQLFRMPQAMTIESIKVMTGIVVDSNTDLTIRDDGGNVMGSVTLTTGDSGGGLTVHSIDSPSNNVFSEGDDIQIQSDGSASSGTAFLIVEYTTN